MNETQSFNIDVVCLFQVFSYFSLIRYHLKYSLQPDVEFPSVVRGLSISDDETRIGCYLGLVH